MTDINWKEVYKDWQKRHNTSGLSSTGTGQNGKTYGYTTEEVMFIKRIVEWRTKHHRIPTMQEIFLLAREMGYRKL